MRRLILSDIHANWEALQAVLAKEAGTYDEILCCGDIVGYGGSPCEVLDWVRSSVRVVIRGNHDRAACGLEDLDWFNDAARWAALWTADAIGESGQQYLHDLPVGPYRGDGFLLAHGSPLDEDEYLVNDVDVLDLEEHITCPLNFIGHTHLQGGWVWNPDGYQRIRKPVDPSAEVTVKLNPTWRYLINPGSVGQPRDGDPRAAYLLWDSSSQTAWLRRVPYNVAAAQAHILEAGLPSLLANRLLTGR